MAQVLVSPPLPWETQIGFSASSFNLAQPWLCGSEPADGKSSQMRQRISDRAVTLRVQRELWLMEKGQLQTAGLQMAFANKGSFA